MSNQTDLSVTVVLKKIAFFALIWIWEIEIVCAGFEGLVHNDERKESRSDADNSEGDKKTKIGSFKKKAINAGNKFRHSLRRRSKKKNELYELYRIFVV